jgi:hypothetical protein
VLFNDAFSYKDYAALVTKKLDGAMVKHTDWEIKIPLTKSCASANSSITNLKWTGLGLYLGN